MSDANQAQQDSTAATIQNIQTEAALQQQPDTPVAKVFRTTQPDASMQMLTPAGRGIVFMAGRCVTQRPEEIAYLQGEINNGNPWLARDVEEVQPETSVADLIAQARADAIAQYIAQTQGASAAGGASDNTGAGTMSTSANISNTPTTALEALQASLAANKQATATSTSDPTSSPDTPAA